MLACAGMSPAGQWSALAALVLGFVMGLACFVCLVLSFFRVYRQRFPKLRLGAGVGLAVAMVMFMYGSMALLVRCGPG